MRTPTARLSHHRFSTMRVVSGTLSASVERPTQRNPQPRGTSHQPTWHNNKHLPTHQHQQQQQQQLKCRPRRRRRRLCLRSVGEAEVAGAPQSAVPRARLQLLAPSRWMVVERLRLQTGACSRSTLYKMYVLPNPTHVLTKQQTPPPPPFPLRLSLLPSVHPSFPFSSTVTRSPAHAFARFVNRIISSSPTVPRLPILHHWQAPAPLTTPRGVRRPTERHRQRNENE
jgi:hypothetical protein